jgi:hypothetical protein
LVKHLTCGELGYFETVFDRSTDQPNPRFEGGYATWGSNIRHHDSAWRRGYRERLEDQARRAAG